MINDPQSDVPQIPAFRFGFASLRFCSLLFLTVLHVTAVQCQLLLMSTGDIIGSNILASGTHPGPLRF